MNTPLQLRPGLLVLGLALSSPLFATPFTVSYEGDALPSAGAYGSAFTTIVFSGTGWSSNGSTLQMTTAPGAGIWFGRTNGYGDPSNFSLASTALGNKVEARVALGTGATEWSLYWYDTDGYQSSLEFLHNGFNYWTATGTTFVARNDMTSFHTFGSHVQNGQVAYYLDGALIGSGSAFKSGSSNFLLFGDGSGSTPTGTGSFTVDFLRINVEAGAIPLPPTSPSSVPESGSMLALFGAALVGLTYLRRRLVS